MACAVLSLGGTHNGIHLYPRVIQYMVMSPDAPVANEGKARGFAFTARLACLTGMNPVSVFTGLGDRGILSALGNAAAHARAGHGDAT